MPGRNNERRHRVLLDHAGPCSSLFPNRPLAPVPLPPSASLSWFSSWSLQPEPAATLGERTATQASEKLCFG